MSKKKFMSSINGKGYYIALILCAAAIGISGYLYYRNANKDPASLQKDPADDGVHVVATDPNGTPVTDPTDGTDPTTPSKEEKPLTTMAPVNGEQVLDYAMDHLTYNPTTRDWRVHNGIDYAAEAGTPVMAAADGTVYTTYQDETMGMTVVISHAGGYVTMYSSLDKDVTVSAGDTVEAGQTIGYVGASALLESAVGDHVHFMVTCDNAYIDPEEFLSLS